MKVRSCKPLSRILSVLFLSALLFSCSSSENGDHGGIGSLFSSDFVDKEAFARQLSAGLTPLPSDDSAFHARLLKENELNVSYAYHLGKNEPLWFNEQGLKKGAEELSRQLNQLWDEGLEPGNYKVGYIEQALTWLKNKKEGSFPVDSIVAWDKAFTTAWLQAARDLLLGGKEIHRGDSLWYARNDTAFNGAAYLARALKSSDEFPTLDSFRPDINEYLQMKKAVVQWSRLKEDSTYLAAKKSLAFGTPDSNLAQVLDKELAGITFPGNDTLNETGRRLAAYQYYRQLRITGKLDSATYSSLKRSPDDYIHNLQLNMDRLRSLPRQAGAEHVWVNIPLMEVNYYRDNEVKFHSRVVVGKRARQTPTLWAPMANVVFNPPWGVPPTILRNDVGPGVGRSGAGYLARKGLRAYDAQGRDVTASVNGSNYRRFSYRQPPGAHNSLGEVKFNLPNKWDIYLHDTPHRENFSSRMRALSSGCVRVQNPKLLAEAILEDRRFTPEKIDSIIQTRRTRFEQLKRNLPVYIVYLTVASDSTGNQLRYLEDVYGRDARMKKVYGY
ncbi:L,D-transpeptidase family protein [Taibaiella helva]|uniref:L,D-transpeptidase family protein n=1 Tax=Taibaiella helva TaxID=2301235 RepID=UPI000E584E0E|nr:L,D-transpeptidase family protein [Taibaiella helva]